MNVQFGRLLCLPSLRDGFCGLTSRQIAAAARPYRHLNRKRRKYDMETRETIDKRVAMMGRALAKAKRYGLVETCGRKEWRSTAKGQEIAKMVMEGGLK
jgi:hypothetical protein